MNTLLSSLNEKQREAASTLSGPVLIVAGAGAGKTKTITHRIGNLIQSGVPAERILAITFTNKAATEMRQRIFSLLGRPQSIGNRVFYAQGIPWISTFHSLGIAILKEYGNRIGIPPSVTILDQDDAKKLVKEALKSLNIDPKTQDPGKILSRISRHKNSMGTWETITETTPNLRFGELLSNAMRLYEAALRKANALDFDDLLEKTVRLLSDHPDICAFYNRRWSHIHVDEYQDTNDVQYALTKLLAGAQHNICVVGDSDQSIYSWRGASLANILNFEKDYPEARVIVLEQNYRSTQHILHAANAVIQHNTLRKEKRLFTENPPGEKICVLSGYDEGDEARKIVERISHLLTQGVEPKDIAILYRTNVQSRVLEEAMLFAGIPYQVLGTRFYDRKEVKDLVAYIRAAQNKENGIDIARIINVPARGIGEKTLEKVLRGGIDTLSTSMQQKVHQFYTLLSRLKEASQTQKPSEYILFAIKETGLESLYADGDEEDNERKGNMYELVSIARRYDDMGPDGIAAFLDDVALEGEQDRMTGANAVRLMTVHASKGLEFDYVFISGLEQDLFPSNKTREHESLESQEEERRLFYVAITRAAKRVFLSHASMRTVFGSRNFTTRSEFIDDIDVSLLEEDTPKIEQKPKRKISLLDDPFDEETYFW